MANTLPETEFTAAIVVIDNTDGSVRGMYTGQEFDEAQFNPVTQKRPPDRFGVQGDHARDCARSAATRPTTASAAARSASTRPEGDVET